MSSSFPLPLPLPLPLPPSLQLNSTSTLSFALNSTRIALHNPDPALTLLEFIRSQGFTGTKLGCNEGGCGACTVVMGTIPRRARAAFPHQRGDDDDEDPPDLDRPIYRSINACLMPLIAVHGSHILTIEGLGTSLSPHPIQLRFGQSGGFQCSACASGIIMAFYALLREKGSRGVTEREVEEGFDGNLCRCTGYRVLLDCAKSFARDWKGGSGNLVVDGDGAGDVESQSKIDDGKDKPDEDSLATPDDPVPIKEATAISGGSGVSTGILPEDRQPGSGPSLCAKGNACCRSSSSTSSKGCDRSDPQNTHTPAPRRIPGIPVFTYKPYTPTAEPLFPPWLKKSLLKPDSAFGKDLILTAPPPLKDSDSELRESSSDNDDNDDRDAHSQPAGEIWVRPSTLHSLLTLLKLYPLAKLRSGNTETGIEVRFKGSRWAVSVWVGPYLTGLAGFEREGQGQGRGRGEREGVRVGAGLVLTDLVRGCRGVRRALGGTSDRDDSADADADVDERAKRGKWENRGKEMILEAIEGNLKHFASTQIRNVATVAGNITTASPISDLNPIWVAVGAELNFLQPETIGEDGLARIARSGRERGEALGKIAMRDFFTGYRKTALPRGAIMMDLFVPFPQPGEKVFTKAYKQSKRKDDDIAIVTCCLRVEIEGERRIRDVRLVYGGMAPTTTESPKTQEYLRGKEWGGRETLWNALEILSGEDHDLPHTVPGGMPAYRKSLAMGFFAKFWAEVSLELGLDLDSDEHRVRDLEGLAASEIHRGLQVGNQDLEDVDLAVPSGQGIPHLAHLKHVTGEAQYCDDIPRQHNELVGALVFSQKPHAKILSIDSEYALSMTGVHDFVTVKDLPGSNVWNPPAMDEVLFAEDEVFTCGQVIGVVLAETKNQAQAAARAIKVEYEELPFILTIAEAIAADSFFKPRPKLERGDIGLIEKADHVLEGWWHMGGQEQFYIETNATLVIPHPEDEMEVWSSTQNPSETQVFVASALGIPQNRVTCRVRRLGGGFGGKETRSICLAAQMAVAAKKNRRPVRCMLDRDEDMISSGQRHPFAAKYKVGFNDDGKLVGMDVEIYNNGGWSQDLSQAVLERAMTHSDNCYMIPNFRIRGKICKTNTMSNSAFRGFGGPQGMLLNECIMTRVAERLNIQPERLREINMYKEGEKTHFGQQVLDWNVPTLWSQLKQSSEFDRRKAEVDAFNKQNKWKKRGIAMIPTKFGISFTAIFLNQAHALVNIYQHDGSIGLWHGGVEMGQGLHTKMAQICATELGCPIEKIHIMETNTMTVINTSATAASAGSDLNGMAIKNACEQLNARLAPYRKALPNATWAQWAHAAFFDRVNLQAHGHYKTPEINGYNWETGEGRPFFYFTQGTAVSEVEVDTLTGDHVILRSDILMDVGRTVNGAIDLGQIEGAFTQGFGLTTMEESLWLNNGQMFTRGPGAYKIPAALDTPREFNVAFLKSQHQKTAHLRTIHSSKGVGEPPLFLGSSVFFALKSALTDARRENGLTGEWTLDTPATCERIRTATGDPLLRLAEKGTEQKEGEKSFFVSIF